LIDVHLLKIGSTAELKFLEIVDIFKKMNVPIKFSLSQKKISEQLKKASDEKAEKLIILGEKEAKTEKIIVREALDSSQKEITIKELERYVKKMI
jgi:histidyl-tRNA synthetase